MTDYLNQDDPLFHRNDQRRALAVGALFARALRLGHGVRLEADGQRLARLIGNDAMSQLGTRRDIAAPYDIYETTLDEEKRAFFARLLALVPDGEAERPLNYIRSVRILDAQGRTLVRGGDHNTFILFALPDAERRALLDRYRDQQIPDSVIESVEVDMEQLLP
jgi:hypothetical protein